MSHPSFPEWFHYQMTDAHDDFMGANTSIEAEGRMELIEEIPTGALLEFYLQFLNLPSSEFDICAPHQLGNAIWSLFGANAALHHTDLGDRSGEFFDALHRFYLNVLDERCCNWRAAPDDPYSQSEKLDTAVYMMWDMGGLCVIPYDDLNVNWTSEAFDALTAILLRCRTSTCRLSILHGLGHAAHRQPLCTPLIERFLSESDPPAWLRDYAEGAKRGAVM